MKVYFAGILENDYILSLMEGLRQKGVEVINGHELFLQKKIPEGVIIHIHWPEAFFNNWLVDDPEILSLYKSAIQYYNLRNNLIFTAHNLTPHDGHKTLNHQLYDQTIRSSHLIIHLGPKSIQQLTKAYSISHSKEQCVVPHHVFPVPKNIPDKKEARSILNMPQNKYILASIGDLRYKEDVEELWQHYEEIKASKGCFLFVHKYRNLVNRYFISNLVKYPSLTRNELQHRFFNPNVVFNTSNIPLKKLCTYISAADIILLPRTQNLNSGVPFLVCNFHKPILTHSDNNIQWSLQELNYKKEGEVFKVESLRSYDDYNENVFTLLKNHYLSMSGIK